MLKMSEEGRIRRGKVYWEKRDRNDNLPAHIADHAGKMMEVETYLNSIKTEDEQPKPKGRPKKATQGA